MNRTGLIRAALAVLLMGTAVCAPAAVWATQQTDAQAGVQESAAQVDAHRDAVQVDAQDADAVTQQDDRSSDFVIDENGVLTAYLGAGGDVVVPDGVIKIGERAFAGISAITSITFPDTITEIEDYAFVDCTGLEEIALPANLERIGGVVFSGCSNLRYVWIPKTLTECTAESVGFSPFQYTSDDLTVEFEDGLTTIPSKLFGSVTGLHEIEIPDSVHSIGTEAFAESGLTSVSIPGSVEVIGDFAFSYCSLETLELGHGVRQIGQQSFAGIDVDELTMPSTIENCDVSFVLGHIGTLRFEEGTEVIPAQLFYLGDIEIERIVFPDTLKEIGAAAFSRVGELTSIVLPESLTTMGEDAFGSIDSLKEVHIPASLGAEGSTVSVPFRGSMNIETVTFGEGITRIPDSLFEWAGLRTIRIPDTVTSIDSWAFSCVDEYDTLTDITIPASVTDIHESNNFGSATIHCEEDSAAHEFAVVWGFNYDFNIPHEHVFGAWETLREATCTEPGLQQRSCSCGETDERAYPEALGHDFSGEVVVDAEPTCTEPGSGHRVCTRCQVASAAEEIAPLGHAYADEWTVDAEPSCTTPGERSHHCERCGDRADVEAVDALGHDYGDYVIDTAPTCTEPGERSRYCSRCNDRTDVETVDALGHSYGDWIVDTPATYFASGAHHRVCDRCAVREDGVIAQLEPDFEAHPDYTFATFRVVNAQTLEPLTDATITLTPTNGSGESQKITTEDLGRAALFAPAGTYDITVEYSQFQVRGFTYTFAVGEVEVPDIGLSAEALVQGELTGREMTKEEIEAAGIDTSDPDNNHVYQYGGAIRFNQGIEGIDLGSFETYVYKNEKGETVGAVFDGERVEQDEDGNDKPVTITVSDPEDETPTKVTRVNEYLYLVTQGEVKWLKEMFHVQLIVVNMSNTDTLAGCTAALDLPSGLSLPSLTAGAQEVEQEVGTVGHLETKTVDWYVRGDSAGDYTLEASLTGTFQELGAPFTYTFRSTEPLHVYAGSDMQLTIHLSDAAYYNEPYTVLYELKNVSDRTIYNVSHRIKELSQFEGQYTHLTSDEAVEDAQDWTELTTEELGKGATIEADELKPGERLMVALTTNVIWKSSMVQAGENAEITHKIMVAIGANKGLGAGIDTMLQIMANIDIRYYLEDTVISTLEGSTAEIPTDFEIDHHAGPSLTDVAVSTAIEQVWDKGSSFGLKYLMGGMYDTLSWVKRTYKGITSIFSVETAEESQRCIAWVETQEGSNVIQVSIDGLEPDENGRYTFTGDTEISVDALNTGTAYLMVQDEDGNVTAQRFEVAETFPGQEHILSSIQDPVGLNDLLMPSGSVFTEDYYELLDEMGWELFYGDRELQDGDVIPTGAVLRDPVSGAEVNIFVPGDVTEDGAVDVADAAAMAAAQAGSGVSRARVAATAGMKRDAGDGLDAMQQLAGDLNGDDLVDYQDALELMAYLTNEGINTRLTDAEVSAGGDDGAVLTATRVEDAEGRPTVVLDLSGLLEGATAVQVDLLDPADAGLTGLAVELVGTESADFSGATVSDAGDYVRAIAADAEGALGTAGAAMRLSCDAVPEAGTVTLPARVVVQTASGATVAAVRAVTLDFAESEPEPVPGETTLTVDLPAEGFTYTGEPLDLSGRVTAAYGDKDATAKVMWSWRTADAADDAAWQAGLPSDAGAYELRAELPARPAEDGVYFERAVWDGETVIAAAPTEAPEGVTGIAESVVGSGGSLSGLPAGTEWRLKGTDAWTAAADDVVLVAPGVYEVRLAASADGNHAASAIVEVRVASFADEHGGIVFPTGSTEDDAGLVVLPAEGGTVVFPDGSSVTLPGDSRVDSDKTLVELPGGATVAPDGNGGFAVTRPDGTEETVPSGTQLAEDGSVVGTGETDPDEPTVPGGSTGDGHDGQAGGDGGHAGGNQAGGTAQGMPATGDPSFAWCAASALGGVAALVAARRRRR